MKNSINRLSKILFAAVALFAATSCAPDKDVKFDELKSYIDTQTVIGVYRDGKAVAAFDKSTDQIYVNRKERLFRIGSADGKRHIAITLSEEPKLGATITAVLETSGYDNLTTTVCPDLKVTSLGEGVCRLAGTSKSSYTGFVVAWFE